MSDASTASLYDAQARSFDLRAGLPTAARARIVHAIWKLGRLRPGETLVDVGAGTGELGLELAACGINYVGLDASAEMLRVFRERARARRILLRLERTDAGTHWPIPDASVKVVFGSRSLHWLDPSHVASEAFRVASPGGSVLLVGRVRHAPEGPRTMLRRKLRELLRSSGHFPKSGEDHTIELLRECTDRGARPLPRRTVATFTIQRSPREIIGDWAGKPGLGGVDLPFEEQREHLEALTAWTARAFGNMDARLPLTEEYTIEGAVLTTFPDESVR